MDNSSRLAALKNRVRQGQGTSLVEAIANASKNNSQTPPTSIPQINAPLVGSSPQSGESSFDSSPKSPIIYSQLPSPQEAAGPPIISSGSIAGTPTPVIESSHFKKSTQEILDAIKKNRANKITTAVTEAASIATSNNPAPAAQSNNNNTALSAPLITYQAVNASVTTNTDTSFTSDGVDMIDLSTQLPVKQYNPPVQSPNATVGVKRPLSAVSPNTGLHQASDAITITSSSSNSTSNEEPPYKRQKVSNTNNVPTLTVTPRSPAARPVPQVSNEPNNSKFVNEFSARRKEAIKEQSSVSQAIKNSYLRPEPAQESRPEPRSDNSAMSEEEVPNDQNNNQEERPKKQKKQRVIPGPAGALPQLLTEDGKPAIPDLSSQKPNNAPKKDPNTLSVDMKKRLEDEVDFRKGPWLSMLYERKLPPYEFNPAALLQCNLRYVLTRGFASKVPELVLFVKSVKSIDEDALVEVKDPTATAEATIHRELLDRLNQQPLQGSVLHVKSISVWSPPPARKVHHLVITAANIIAHYPVDSPIPQVPEVNTDTYSLLSPYNLRVTDAELEAKSPSKIARAAMPKMANSAAGTPKRPALPAAVPKTNGTSVFDMMATAAQPKVPTARGQPTSPAPKAPPKYNGPQTPGGPPKYGTAPKTPYRPPPQNSPAPGPSKAPYRPAPGPNQIVNDQSQTPVTPTWPNPPYNNNAPTQGMPKQPPRPMQAPFDINNPANQIGNNQPNYSQPPPQPQQPTYNNARQQQQQPLRRSPQDFPQANHNPNMNNAPPINQPNNYAPQPNYHNNAPGPRPVNNNPPQPPMQQQPYAQPPYNPNSNPPYSSPAQPRTNTNAPNTATLPYTATPINTNLPSQTPTSSMPSSGLSHATSNLYGSISNFSRSGNNRFLAGMAANNVWGNPTLNANNTAPQSTSGQITPDPNNRR